MISQWAGMPLVYCADPQGLKYEGEYGLMFMHQCRYYVFQSDETERQPSAGLAGC